MTESAGETAPGRAESGQFSTPSPSGPADFPLLVVEQRISPKKPECFLSLIPAVASMVEGSRSQEINQVVAARTKRLPSY